MLADLYKIWIRMDRAVFTQFIDLYNDKTSRENYLTFLRSPKYCQKASFRNQC